MTMYEVVKFMFIRMLISAEGVPGIRRTVHNTRLRIKVKLRRAMFKAVYFIKPTLELLILAVFAWQVWYTHTVILKLYR